MKSLNVKMVTAMENIKLFFQERAFGVCSKLGEKLHFPIDSIRLFFIYSSFITLGSPIIVYVGLGMLMKIRTYLRRMNNPVLFD
jgi:phage shock protein PspC (stress-responsive transcriptional regulator)